VGQPGARQGVVKEVNAIAAIGAAMKRGLQTRDWKLDMGRALDNP
jgi:hypothetical protein